MVHSIYMSHKNKCWQITGFSKWSQLTPTPPSSTVNWHHLWPKGIRASSLLVLFTPVRKLNNWSIRLGNTVGQHVHHGLPGCCAGRGQGASARPKEWGGWWNDIICNVNTQKGNVDMLLLKLHDFVFKDSRGNCMWMTCLHRFLLEKSLGCLPAPQWYSPLSEPVFPLSYIHAMLSLTRIFGYAFERKKLHTQKAIPLASFDLVSLPE